ncbi:MAG: dihydroorotate dehydrogenase [Actinomycetota bacterium]|jgi:dihydroorotate dehydrogenase (NAD+) catalytic subunit
MARDTWSGLGTVSVGGVELANPVMTASGTAGHDTELGAYFDLSLIGAVVVKSLYHGPWAGNPPPRVHVAGSGMMNAVGLEGPGVEAWCADSLPRLRAAGAVTVASIWGRSVDDYRRAAAMLAPHDGIAAVEVNLSCPNLEGRSSIFAHDPALSAEVVRTVVSESRVPVWAKLSANTDRITEVASAVAGSGASAVTLINTMLGMQIDPVTRRPSLGNGGGGLSGPPIHAIAVRAVHDVATAAGGLDIIGVGGVTNGTDAVEMLLAGAKAVQVGTATFARPDAALRVLRSAAREARRLGVTSWSELTGAGLARR